MSINKLNSMAKNKGYQTKFKEQYPAICYLTEIYPKPKDMDNIA